MTSVANETAPGWPGISPRWTSSAKEGVGTSASYQSRVWFTISHGILNEVYYPRIDQANTRDMEFLVADGDQDRKSTRLNSSHTVISYAVFCLKKKSTSFR